METEINKTILCPSAQADSPNIAVFGVISGTVEAPRVAYLKQPQPVTEELLSQSAPVTPTEIFRLTTPCAAKECVHFDGMNCRFAKQVVEKLPVVVEELPPCSIRRDCRWWQQEGKAACMRCPQIITDNYNPSALIRQIGVSQSLSVAEIQNGHNLSEVELTKIRGGEQRHTYEQLKALRTFESSGAQPV